MSAKSGRGLKDDTSLGSHDRWIAGGRIFGAIIGTLLCSGFFMIMWAVWYEVGDGARAATASVAQPPSKPNLFIHLEAVEGLDLCASAPPAFHLAVDADWIPASYKYCSGGDNSMLRVSYHGMILAWGHVPWFCVEGCPDDDGVDGVVTVEAKADGAVLREEVRGLVLSDLHVAGKVEFDVEGEVSGLGYLRCKTFLFKGNATEEPGVCMVQ